MVTAEISPPIAHELSSPPMLEGRLSITAPPIALMAIAPIRAPINPLMLYLSKRDFASFFGGSVFAVFGVASFSSVSAGGSVGSSSKLSARLQSPFTKSTR